MTNVACVSGRLWGITWFGVTLLGLCYKLECTYEMHIVPQIMQVVAFKPLKHKGLREISAGLVHSCPAVFETSWKHQAYLLGVGSSGDDVQRVADSF